MTGRPVEIAEGSLRTARLALDPLDPGRDAEDLYAAFRSAEAMRFWDTPPVRDVASTAERLAGYAAAPGAAHWAVRESAGGPAIGLVGMLTADEIPGLQWIVVPERWSEGIASEATVAVVEHLFGRGIARLEAWIETTNGASAAVARRAGFVPRGRIPQHFPHRDRPHESVVWGREADPGAAGGTVVGVVPELVVRDPRATASVLERAFGGRTQVEHGEPAEFVAVGLDPWNGSARVHLVRASLLGRLTSRPAYLMVETAADLDSLVARATAAGLRCERPPQEQPWCRREAVLTLPEGHRITVSGPA